MDKTLIVNKLKCVNRSKQAIIITNYRAEQFHAVLETFERADQTWHRAFKPMHAVIGKKGFAYNKLEGDKKSPMGTYTLGQCFGKFKNSDTFMPYRQTTAHDVWVNDSDSANYNTWQTGPSYNRWKSAEPLRLKEDVRYDYAVVINYNTTDRIPGRGSAVFLSIWNGIDHPTRGDTAIAYYNLLRIVKWLDPAKNPLLIQGPFYEVLSW